MDSSTTTNQDNNNSTNTNNDTDNTKINQDDITNNNTNTTIYTDSDKSTTNTTTNKYSYDPDDYVTMMLIGQGNFSELYMVEHKTTKILYTQKMFTKRRVEQIKKQCDVLMEKHVMKKLPEHNNIIKCYGTYKDEMYLYLLYEYVNGGELWKKSIIYGLPNEKLVKYYFLQVLDGISHMHKYNIVHRDIKVMNLLKTDLI